MRPYVVDFRYSMRSNIVIVALSFLTGCIEYKPEPGPGEWKYPNQDPGTSESGGLTVEVTGAAGDCSIDDAPAIQAAVDAVVAAGGGEVIIPYVAVGCYRLQSPIVADIGYATASGTSAPLRIRADLGVILVPDIDDAATVLTVDAGGSPGADVELVDLTWVDQRLLDCDLYAHSVCPTPSVYPLDLHLVHVSGSHSHALVQNLRVHGIWSAGSHVKLTNVEATVDGIGCYSCYAGLGGYGSQGFLQLDGVTRAIVSSVDAIDYTNLYIPRTTIDCSGASPPYSCFAGVRATSGAAAWAVIDVLSRCGDLEGFARPTSWISISGLFCDEGTQACLRAVDGCRGEFLEVDGLKANVASLTGAMGIYAVGWDHVEVRNSVFGYAYGTHYAIVVQSVGETHLYAVETDGADTANALYSYADCDYVHVEESDIDVTDSYATLTRITSLGVDTCLVSGSPDACP